VWGIKVDGYDLDLKTAQEEAIKRMTNSSATIFWEQGGWRQGSCGINPHNWNWIEKKHLRKIFGTESN
jgi:hypothetical protein